MLFTYNFIDIFCYFPFYFQKTDSSFLLFSISWRLVKDMLLSASVVSQLWTFLLLVALYGKLFTLKLLQNFLTQTNKYPIHHWTCLFWNYSAYSKCKVSNKSKASVPQSDNENPGDSGYWAIYSWEPTTPSLTTATWRLASQRQHNATLQGGRTNPTAFAFQLGVMSCKHVCICSTSSIMLVWSEMMDLSVSTG